MFTVEREVLTIAKWEKIEEVHATGKLEQAAWLKLKEGHDAHLTKHLGLMKKMGMNICKTC